MQMDRERRNSIVNGDYSYSTTNGNYNKICNDDYTVLDKEINQNSPPSSLRCDGFIEHPVSRFDTLAGVAIKYGVEVADIKKMNSLVTDLQMFALNTLQIPLPGRHPPSPSLSNDCKRPGQSSANQTPARHMPPNLLDSFQSSRPKTTLRRVSSAMISLQGFYGLKPTGRNTTSEGFEMAQYRKGEACYLEDGPFLKPSSASKPPLKLRRNSRSESNGFIDENGEVRADIMFARTAHTPEKLLEDNTSSGGFSTITSKGLALRPKAASRTNLLADAEGGFSPTSTGLGDGYVVDGFSAVRKSSSTSNLQEQDISTSLSSLWPASKWNLKPDLQALSAAAITTSIFDGLPKPMTSRKNKAALD